MAKELPPIKESTADYEQVERVIKRAFLTAVYRPIMELLEQRRIENSRSSLLDAIKRGLVAYDGDKFTGKFNSGVSKELRSYGALWREGAFHIEPWQLPTGVANDIQLSAARFAQRLADIDKHLEQILPAQIAGKVKAERFFDSALWKVDKAVKDSLKSITITPTLSPEMRKRIAAEWQSNLDIWIKDFAADEIKKLRKDVQAAVFSGSRRDYLIRAIKRSYGVTENKAKFLARQETGLLMAKFKETRYAAAGITEYRWGCVQGSKLHPVRPSHKILEGKIFSWNSPPTTTAPDEPVRRNNPGQDYNCRCFARPIVRFKGK